MGGPYPTIPRLKAWAILKSPSGRGPRNLLPGLRKRGLKKNGTSSRVLDNLHRSDWSCQWSNLTVTEPCPPWGCSKIFYSYERADHWPPIPPKKREAMQRLAERLREL